MTANTQEQFNRDVLRFFYPDLDGGDRATLPPLNR
jgi:hypothetical protein